MILQIRKLIGKLEEHRGTWRSRQASIRRLMKLLGTLLEVLRQEHHAAHKPIEEARREAESLLASHARGDQEAFNDDRLAAWAAKVRAALEGLDRPSSPPPERDRFWA